MGEYAKTTTGVIFTLSQYVSGTILAATAFGLLLVTGLSAAGVLPWRWRHVPAACTPPPLPSQTVPPASPRAFSFSRIPNPNPYILI